VTDPANPAAWQILLAEAEQALDEGRHDDALQLCDRAAHRSDEARYHAALLRGDILLDLGDAAGALSSYETVAHPERTDPGLDCARGVALFELGRLPEAENALQSAVTGAPDLAEAHYTLGLIAELLGTGREAGYFRAARRLDKERFRAPTPMSQEAFESAVDEALHGLAAGFVAALEHVPVLVVELPHPDDLRHAEPPLSPLALGMFVGTPPTLAGAVMDTPDPRQATMVLYKRNLERAAPKRAQLIDEIRRTVAFELGAALGMSELEVEERLDEAP